jgi:hypothetical protein
MSKSDLCRECGIRLDMDGLCQCPEVLLAEIEKLRGERDVVRESLLSNFTDAIDRSKWSVARVAGNTEALVANLRRTGAKANEAPGLSATLDEQRWLVRSLRAKLMRERANWLQRAGFSAEYPRSTRMFARARRLRAEAERVEGGGK